MNRAALWKISVTTSTEAEDAVGELLSHCLGKPVSTYEDLTRGITTVAGYISEPLNWVSTRGAVADGLKRIRACGLALGPGKISLHRLRHENWATSWKRHFRPLLVGGALLIKPSWSPRRAKKNQAVVVLDPGLSFGTGQHPTTRFCLEQVAAHRPRFKVARVTAPTAPRRRDVPFATPVTQPSFLDVGTGSGILAIAAAKLGYAPVDALDLDADAVRIARSNARRNRVLDRIRLRQADASRLPLRAAPRYSLVCANLVSSLLISEQRRLLAALQPQGVLVLAGILETEFEKVHKSFIRAGLRLLAAHTANEWRSGAFAWNHAVRK